MIGDRYEGEWKECLKHGNGTDIYHNGDSYIGQYRFGIKSSYKVFITIIGKPCGYGQYFWKNGGSYTGEFLDGLKHGFGKWRKSKDRSTNIYEGQYYKDKKQGFGIFKWASGNVYIGQYKNDDREGIGKMIWTDGSMYIGQLGKGIQNGYGRMYFPDSSMKEGIFESNVFKGRSGIDLDKVPRELFDQNFDIMTYVPRDLRFSEEIVESIKEFPNVADDAMNSKLNPDKSSYSALSNYPNRALHRQNAMVFSHDTSSDSRSRKKRKNKSFTTPEKKLIAQEYGGIGMPQISESAGKQRMKFNAKKGKKRKAWVPAGKARCVDIIRGPRAVYT